MGLKGIRRKWFGIRLAEEALKVSDLSELMQINRDMVRSHNKTFLDNYEDGVEDGDMGSIHIGDVVTNKGKPALPVGGVGKGLVTMLVAAAISGGAGLGFFGPALLGTGVGDVVGGSDVDTKYILGLGKPDEPESKNEIREGEGKDKGR